MTTEMLRPYTPRVNFVFRRMLTLILPLSILCDAGKDWGIRRTLAGRDRQHAVCRSSGTLQVRGQVITRTEFPARCELAVHT